MELQYINKSAIKHHITVEGLNIYITRLNAHPETIRHSFEDGVRLIEGLEALNVGPGPRLCELDDYLFVGPASWVND